jgi:conjugal transfer pilus assembly protein TraB
MKLTLKSKKYIIAGGIGGVALLLILCLVFWQEAVPPPAIQPQKTEILGAGETIPAQDLFMTRMETEHKLTQEKLKTLEALLTRQAKSQQSDQSKVKMLERALEERMKALHEKQQRSPQTTQQKQDFSEEPVHLPLQKITLNLQGKPEKRLKTVENTLPAGTFVKATLLGGVDASTATSAPSDPRPVLIRIRDDGTLPRCLKSDLKDCHVLASCYGDLSSERVYMRLEKLTCTERLTGEILETEVAGYVAGEDGKAGVRGVVIDKAGPAIRNSLLGGFFSGLGKAFENQQTMAMPVLSNSSLNPQQLFMRASTSGASSALDKYAEFFIKRAEQLQPILQVAAGRTVDIVFTQGTSFGDSSVKKTLQKIRDRGRREATDRLAQGGEAETTYGDSA